MHDVMLQSLKADLSRMHARLSALESEVQQLRRVREAKLDVFRQVRWCITCAPEDEEEEYPTTPANVFPIKFLDCHFTPTAGLQTLSHTARQTAAATVAHASTGQFVPEGVPLPCFWLRGLGGADAGEWWLLDPPQRHYGKLAGALSPNGTQNMHVWLLGASGWYNSGATIVVQDWFMRFAAVGSSLPAGTGLCVNWHLASGSHAKYVVDSASCLVDDLFD
jgi:hypothetical protein